MSIREKGDRDDRFSSWALAVLGGPGLRACVCNALFVAFLWLAAGIMRGREDDAPKIGSLSALRPGSADRR